MIDTTVGIESVMWYQRDQKDRRRVQITFQDSLRKGFIGGEKLPGEIELFGDSKEAPLGRMSVDSPESLEELSKALEIAATHWRHCINECECHQEKTSEPGEALSFENINLSDIFGEPPDEDPEHLA